MTAYTSDLRSMVDEVHRGIGIVAESDFLVHEHFVGEGVEHFGLLVLRRVGFGGISGAAKGVVLRWAQMTCLQRPGKCIHGEAKDREENCEMHYVLW